MRFSYEKVAVVLLPLLPRVDAFWRMNCAKIITGRIDPVVTPGKVSSHTHTIVGASNIGINSTYDTLFDSACTSCEIQDDKSAYWSPLLYFQYANGSFIDVPHGGAVIYYLARGPIANSTIPYPKGFKMVGGQAFARSYDNKTLTFGNATYPGRPVSDAANFVCLPDGPPVADQYGMINDAWSVFDCVNGFRAQIHFPTCWNGVDLYKSDQTHVVHMSQIDNGICPPTHPNLLPHLFMEVNYAVNQVPGNTTGGRFVFANGDPTGYGFHGDFQNGWDDDVQRDAVENCLIPDNFGQISYCPSLQKSQTNGYPASCPTKDSPIQERVSGLLDKLPGCVEVTEGPTLAPLSSMVCPASVQPPPVTPTMNSQPQTTIRPDVGSFYPPGSLQSFLGCFNDTAGGVRALNDIAYSSDSMDVSTCQAYCNARGYRLSGVEYSQECHCSNTITNNATTGQTACTWLCSGTVARENGTQEICGGYGYITIYNNTNASFVASGSQTIVTGSSGSGGGSIPVPSTPLAPYAANYLGCASDEVGSRTLQGEAFTNPNMTVEMCSTFAKYANNGAGYQYFGVEYASECYAGNTITPPGMILDAKSSPPNSTCNIRCAGKNTEMCGGSGAMSLYRSTTYVKPIIKSPIGTYSAIDCLLDLQPGQGRSLTGATTSNDYMTEDMCINFCKGNGMKYAGVEYSTQCFCGNQIAGQTVNCSNYDLKACPGNLQQSCGGASLLNLWYSST